MLHAIIDGARMAVIMFNSSRMHWQIATCVTKADFCFPCLEKLRWEKEKLLSQVLHKISDAASGEIWMAWLRECLIRQEHFNQNSYHL